MLLCKFASPRSEASRVLQWLQYLDDLEKRYANDEEAVRTLRNLRKEAYTWLPQSIVEALSGSSLTAVEGGAASVASPLR
jgi:hypothetical protein